jgi:hypothetical protein
LAAQCHSLLKTQKKTVLALNMVIDGGDDDDGCRHHKKSS